MEAYLIDAIYAKTPFPLLNWGYAHTQQHIHVYYSNIWVVNCQEFIYEICDHFMVPLNIFLHGELPLRFIEMARDKLKDLLDWFIDEQFSYIIFYVYEENPHFLPKYILEILLLRETTYQIVVTGIAKNLARNSKMIWPIFSMRLGIYTLLNLGHAKKEAKSRENICLYIEKLKKVTLWESSKSFV